jgi:hypothetical protein
MTQFVARGRAHNMQLKLTKQPVTNFAIAKLPPERLGSLTGCYAAPVNGVAIFDIMAFH